MIEDSFDSLNDCAIPIAGLHIGTDDRNLRSQMTCSKSQVIYTAMAQLFNE